MNTSITELEFEDGAFELVVCSHVLEHIEDDAAAMAELFRVTSPGGATIVQVPLDFDATTDEDPSVREPSERLRRWGNASHVRMYGLDVVERLTNAGFVVTQLVPQSFLGTYQAHRQGLDRAVTAFLCRRPS